MVWASRSFPVFTSSNVAGAHQGALRRGLRSELSSNGYRADGNDKYDCNLFQRDHANLLLDRLGECSKTVAKMTQ